MAVVLVLLACLGNAPRPHAAAQGGAGQCPPARTLAARSGTWCAGRRGCSAPLIFGLPWVPDSRAAARIGLARAAGAGDGAAVHPARRLRGSSVVRCGLRVDRRRDDDRRPRGAAGLAAPARGRRARGGEPPLDPRDAGYSGRHGDHDRDRGDLTRGGEGGVLRDRRGYRVGIRRGDLQGDDGRVRGGRARARPHDLADLPADPGRPGRVLDAAERAAGGRLLASQPGLTLGNPLLAFLWGTGLLGEEVAGGPWLSVVCSGRRS